MNLEMLCYDAGVRLQVKSESAGVAAEEHNKNAQNFDNFSSSRKTGHLSQDLN